MLRKTIITVFALASIGILAPDTASARGGFGGGGFRGGGGFSGGGFRGGGIGMGGAGFRAAAIGGGGLRAVGPAGFRGGTFASNSFRAAAFHPGFRHHRRFPFVAAAIGAGFAYGAYPYGYYDDAYYGYPSYATAYPYGDGYYDDYYYGTSNCYILRKRVLTPYGWALRPVQVCG